MLRSIVSLRVLRAWTRIQTSSRARGRDSGLGLRPEEVHVPLYVSLLVLIGYVLLGALLFGLWEPEWDVLVGFNHPSHV